jgi:hypothetical protein
MIRKLDETQSELHEGPCIEAIEDPPESGVVVAQDFAGADAERWPRFAPRAVDAGYRALLSTQLSTHGGPRAALYSRTMAGLKLTAVAEWLTRERIRAARPDAGS